MEIHQIGYEEVVIMQDETYFNSIIVQGTMMRIYLIRDMRNSVDVFLEGAKKLTEHILVWVTCPRCDRDVPAIDMTKDGHCFLCQKEMDEKGGEDDISSKDES